MAKQEPRHGSAVRITDESDRYFGEVGKAVGHVGRGVYGDSVITVSIDGKHIAYDVRNLEVADV